MKQKLLRAEMDRKLGVPQLHTSQIDMAHERERTSVFPMCSLDNKSPVYSSTLFSILDDFRNVAVWIATMFPVITIFFSTYFEEILRR